MSTEDEKAIEAVVAGAHRGMVGKDPALVRFGSNMMAQGMRLGIAHQKAKNESLKKSLLYWIECRMQEIGYEEQETGAFVPNGVSVEGEFWALQDIYERIQEWKPKIIEGEL